MTKRKKNKNLFFLSSIAIILILAGAYFLFWEKGQDPQNEPQEEVVIEEKEVESETGDNDSRNRTYSSKTLGFSFSKPSGYEISQDNLSNEQNSKLILENGEKKTSATFYGNYTGPSEFFADYIYYMQKSGDGFSVFKKEEGYIPEKDDDEPFFSSIAVFGSLSDTSKVSGKNMIVVWNANPKNTYEADFEQIIKSIKEI